MIVMVGEGTGKRWEGRLRPLGWGRMFIRRQPSPYPGEPWGFDNGAFGCWRDGRRFDGSAFIRRVERVCQSGLRPTLAVLPDIVAAGADSLIFSAMWRRILWHAAWLPRKRRRRVAKQIRGWPWYLAVQDGINEDAVRAFLPQVAGLFLGGTDAFKLQAERWCELAHADGKQFHYARAGTLAKAEHAMRVGADSLDSAFPMWNRWRWEQFVNTICGRHPQLRLDWSKE